MSRMSQYFREHDRGWVLSLLVVSGIVYLPFLGNPFCFDDLPVFSSDIISRYAHSSDMLDLRWLAYASLGWTAALFGDVAPHFFRLGNLLIHAANAILLFYLLRQLVGAVLPAFQDSPLSLRGAWVAALIFALHPVAVYAVGYVVQRSTLMATLFVLLMQMAYLRGLCTGKARWLALAVLCYLLAVFSKEHSVLAPSLLVAMSVLVRGNTLSKRALWLTWGGFVIVAVLVTLRSKNVLASPYEAMATGQFVQQGVVAGAPMLHLLSGLTQTGLFFKYLLLWLVPNVGWMSVDMREPFIASWADWRSWLGAIAFVVYGAAATRLLLRGGVKGLVGFALLYPWLLFGVELAGIRVQEPFVLYRSYLWMPGLMLLIPVLVLRFPQRRTWLVLGCVAIVLVPLAWNRLWIFGDKYRLWNDAALLLTNERAAGADRIYYNRGQALFEAGKWEEAVKDLERSAAISPQLEPVRYLLGQAYSNAGRYEEALLQFDAAIDIKADEGGVYFSKGVALTRLHRKDEARQQFAQGCKLNVLVACVMNMPPNNKLKK